MSTEKEKDESKRKKILKNEMESEAFPST